MADTLAERRETRDTHRPQQVADQATAAVRRSVAAAWAAAHTTRRDQIVSAVASHVREIVPGATALGVQRHAGSDSYRAAALRQATSGERDEPPAR